MHVLRSVGRRGSRGLLSLAFSIVTEEGARAHAAVSRLPDVLPSGRTALFEGLLERSHPTPTPP